jgi:hypothetical protein
MAKELEKVSLSPEYTENAIDNIDKAIYQYLVKSGTPIAEASKIANDITTFPPEKEKKEEKKAPMKIDPEDKTGYKGIKKTNNKILFN